MYIMVNCLISDTNSPKNSLASILEVRIYQVQVFIANFRNVFIILLVKIAQVTPKRTVELHVETMRRSMPS